MCSNFFWSANWADKLHTLRLKKEDSNCVGLSMIEILLILIWTSTNRRHRATRSSLPFVFVPIYRLVVLSLLSLLTRSVTTYPGFGGTGNRPQVRFAPWPTKFSKFSVPQGRWVFLENAIHCLLSDQTRTKPPPKKQSERRFPCGD